MKINKTLGFAAMVVGVLITNGLGAEKSVIAPDAKLQKLVDGFAFTEGATCDAKGNVYFTDQPNDRIHKWSVDGKLSTWMEPAGRSNGMMFDPRGNLFSCADGKNELWVITPSKKITVLVKDYQGKLLNAPNDVWLRPEGGLYFTDPYYRRDYWKRGPQEQDVEGVYFLSADHKTLTRVAGDLKQPNGITGTPDGKILYVADYGAKKTYAYDIQSDGSLKNRRLFCESASDGMTIDREANLYLTFGGVLVFDRTGRKIATIEVPEQPANVCFGGKDRKTLFITAGKSLYSITMRVKGVDTKGGK